MSDEVHIPYVYSGEVLAAAIVLPVVGAFTIALRLWMRISKKQRLGWDDWTILMALGPLIGMGICLIYGVAKHAVGYASVPYPVPLSNPVLEELTENTPKQRIVMTMYWTIWLLMIPCNGLIKISAILLYRRIFLGTVKKGFFDILTKAMFVICSCWTVAFFFAQIFGCGTAFYKPFGDLLEVASCNTNTRLNALMISDLVTDILVWLMPLTVVWGLQMDVRKKLGVSAVLLLASASLVAAVIRLIVELQIANGGYAAHTDVDLTLTINLYWSMLESGIALIAACLPTLHLVLLRQKVSSALTPLLSLLRSRSSSSSSGGAYSKESGSSGQSSTEDFVSKNQRAAHIYSERRRDDGDLESQVGIRKTESTTVF